MKSKGQRAAVTTGLMGLCLLFCLAVSVSVVRRCEAAFYDRAQRWHLYFRIKPLM